MDWISKDFETRFYHTGLIGMNGMIGKEVLELPCCIEAPPGFEVKARYAVTALLYPLGIQPVWVQRDSLDSKGLYYGPQVHEMPPGIVTIPLLDETVQYFATQEQYTVERVHWRFWENERWPVLFGGPSEEEDDLIASSFFWLSGWQEYTIQKRDIHGRFPFDASLHAAFSLTHQPPVDAYRERLASRLLEADIAFHRRTWEGKTWAFCPTHDIDYMRKWRPGMIYRESVQYFLGNALNQSFFQRTARLGAFLVDWLRPGDVFRNALTRMVHETTTRQGGGTYFFKTDAHGPRDVYYPISSSRLKKVLRQLVGLNFEIGLHPSYHAYNHAGYMKQEKALLEASATEPITAVRQHYLRYDADLTPFLHLNEGFSIDSSLAFAEHEGFRRGTCHPFQLFSIRENRVLDLWEMPLSIMDGALFNRRALTPQEAIDITRRMMLRCKRFGGVCVALWHNTLWDELDFPGWGKHFIETMDFAVQEEAYVHSLSQSLDAYRGFSA